jgi:hypothetical protein
MAPGRGRVRTKKSPAFAGPLSDCQSLRLDSANLLLGAAVLFWLVVSVFDLPPLVPPDDSTLAPAVVDAFVELCCLVCLYGFADAANRTDRRKFNCRRYVRENFVRRAAPASRGDERQDRPFHTECSRHDRGESTSEAKGIRIRGPVRSPQMWRKPQFPTQSCDQHNLKIV